MRKDQLEQGVSDLIEYFIISSMLMLLIIITILTMTPVIIDRPVDQLSDYAFIDIGNGVSTRIVDLYVITPESGKITTKFDIPDDVVGREYTVTIQSEGEGYMGDLVRISRARISREVQLAGIGRTINTSGQTTGHGLNLILYDSKGFD
jgi:hypothetical protein